MNHRGNWQRTTLGEALPIHYGKARSEKVGTVRENSPVYGSSGVIGKFDRALTNGPTLIVGRKGTVGATHYSDEPCWPIDTVYFAEAREDNDLRFFKYLLDHLQLGRMDRSTAVPGLSRDDYNAKEVAIPDIDEQERIVAEIEKQFTRLDAGVASLKRTQIALKRYRATVLKAACEGRLVPTEAELARKENRSYETGQQLLQRILKERREKWNGKGKYKEPAAMDTNNLPSIVPEGWTLASIDQISSHITSGSRDWSQYYNKGRGTFILAQNVRPMRLNLTERQSVDAPQSDPETMRTRVHHDDLLVTIVGARTGDICRVPDELSEHYVCQSVALVRPVISASARFLELFLASPENGQAQWKKYIYGQGRPHLSFDQLKTTAIPFPPAIEQEQIITEFERRVSVVDEIEFAVVTNVERGKRLRAAILEMQFKARDHENQSDT